MERIIGPRQCGKTTLAINIATTENIPILVKNEYDKRSISMHQLGIGDWNPKPLSIYDILRDDFRGVKSVIVDDADFTLQGLLKQYRVESVRAITMCNSDISPYENEVANNFTVNDFISKIDSDSAVIIFEDDREVFNNVEECHRDVDNIHVSLKRRFVKKIYFDDQGIINIYI